MLSMNVRSSSIGSHLYKVDLSCLEALRDSLVDDREIDFDSM